MSVMARCYIAVMVCLYYYDVTDWTVMTRFSVWVAAWTWHLEQVCSD